MLMQCNVFSSLNQLVGNMTAERQINLETTMVVLTRLCIISQSIAMLDFEFVTLNVTHRG